MGTFFSVLLDNNNNSTQLETLLCLIHPSNKQFFQRLLNVPQRDSNRHAKAKEQN